MAVVDVVLGIVLAYGAWQGWSKGFFCRCAGWAGFGIGLWVAGMSCLRGGTLLAVGTGWPVAASRLVAFVAVWVAVSLAFGLLARMLTAVAEGVGLQGLNRLTGALVGLLVYALVLSCLIHAAEWAGWSAAGRRSVLYAPLRSLAVYTYDGCSELVRPVFRGTVRDIGRSLDMLQETSGGS